MNWSQFVLFALNVDSPHMFARCFNLMAFVMESHLTCSFAGHPRQPGCLWDWALRCWRGASSALLARKTNRSRDWRELEDSNVVLIDKLTLAASPAYENIPKPSTPPPVLQLLLLCPAKYNTKADPVMAGISPDRSAVIRTLMVSPSQNPIKH